MSLEDSIISLTNGINVLIYTLEKFKNIPLQKSLKEETDSTQPNEEIAVKENILAYETDIMPLTIQLAKEKGRDEVIRILNLFKADNAKQLPESKWPLYITECKISLGEKQ